MKAQILLADDHTVVREGLRILLEAQPWIEVVAEAATGIEAVASAKRLQPDVAVLDIAMPEMNGIDATEQICAACPGTRVLVLSMHASSEHVFRALRAGATGYVLKESAGAEVVAAVRSVHAGRRYLSQKITDLVVDRIQHKHDPASPLEALSLRERQIMQLIVEGHTSVEVAQRLHLSPKTVETYRARLMHKLGVSDFPSLIKFAITHGVTSPL